MPCLLLHGESNLRKTQIVRKFNRDHPSTFNEQRGAERARASTTEARRSPEHRLTAAAPDHCSLSGGTNRQACLEGCRDAGHCRVFHARTNAYLSSCPKEAALRCCLPRRGTLTLRPTARPSFVSARTGKRTSAKPRRSRVRRVRRDGLGRPATGQRRHLSDAGRSQEV